jgi:hypothetical protein
VPQILKTPATSDQEPLLGDVRHLLSSHRWTEVQRGIQFAVTRNERGILTQLADGLSIDDQGCIVVSPPPRRSPSDSPAGISNMGGFLYSSRIERAGGIDFTEPVRVSVPD